MKANKFIHSYYFSYFDGKFIYWSDV